MFQKNIQWFVDRLVERIVPTLGSYFASALQRMLILGHAEHHNQLEEQAQRYDAAGRTEIAAIIREQAKRVSLDHVLPLSDKVLEEFGADNPTLFEGSASGIPLIMADTTTSRRPALRKRRTDEPVDAEGTAE